MTTIKAGHDAMDAYTKMQFTTLSEWERSALRGDLLRYCELDTLAMVMIFEYWNNLIGDEPNLIN